MTTPIERIRAELDLPRGWKILDLPGEPALNRDLRSPFREDKTPSFRLYQAAGHIRWHDHGTGAGGDVLDLWATAKNISVPEAIQEILGYLDGGLRTGYRFTKPQATPANAPGALYSDPDLPPAILWPENLSEPTEAECQTLAALRGLSPEPFYLAGTLGTLLMGDQRGQRLWITTDEKRRTASRRRLDGHNLDLINSKSASLKNSPRDWPVGLMTRNPDYDALENILLVEGEGDYYAGLELAIQSEINFRVVCVMGANTTHFADGARDCLRGKKILLIGHQDPIGQKAIPQWVKELYRLGVKSVVSQALPFEHDDLSDFLQSPGSDNPLELLKGFSSDANARARST